MRTPPPDPRRFDLHDIAERTAVPGGPTGTAGSCVRMRDGRRAFLQRAVDAGTSDDIRVQARIHDALEGAPFLPRRLDYVAGPAPTLWLEDLGDAHWPGPWRPGDVPAVQRALAALHATPAPAWVRPLDPDAAPSWATVAADPNPLIGRGLVSAGWLRGALPTLLAAERTLPSGRGVLSHLDVRSGQLCIRDGAALLVGWRRVRVAPAGLDAALWAPSLAAETGGMPEDTAPPGAAWPARVSGLLCAQAGRPGASHRRPVPLGELRAALSWATRALDLPPLDGHTARSTG